ncbi:MAG: type III pantothenate kinase [Desulfovibrio sp.]|jgi:type III pantothenate kinase|nr:type III pantothenate kinase [Desulfovibrio sp.]
MGNARLLLFDIGNTAVKVGLADVDRVSTSYTLRADIGQTADSLGLTLTTLLAHARVHLDGIDACIASSVVPAFDPLLREAVERYVGRPLYRVSRDVVVPLENRYDRPEEVGADRLVGAYAARRLFPERRCIVVVDFGTAVTFDCVQDDAYMGGLIFPGPATALAALSREAAKLPRVDLDVESPEPDPCRNTVTSIRHGLVFGFTCLVEGLTGRLGRRMPERPLIIGTGGFAGIVGRMSDVFDHQIPCLLLEGLRMLHNEVVAGGDRPDANLQPHPSRAKDEP